MNQHPFFSDRRVVILLASFCCLLWGSAYPAIKNGYALFGWWRIIVGGLALLGLTLGH